MLARLLLWPGLLGCLLATACSQPRLVPVDEPHVDFAHTVLVHLTEEGIQPPEPTLRQGTVVVFVSQVAREPLNLTLKGESLNDSAASPHGRGFEYLSGRAYLSRPLTLGQAASVQLLAAGDLRLEVQGSDTRFPATSLKVLPADKPLEGQ